MLLEDARLQAEEELTWRKEEIYFFKNILIKINKKDDQDKYRKSLVLILYSHFEGFCKTLLSIYIQYINDLKLRRKELNYNLRAASMNDVFNHYDNLDRKCNIFKRQLPDDGDLHKQFRRIDFVTQFNDFLDEVVELNETIINTNSNLKFQILKKNLYLLGIDYKQFEDLQRDIDLLVNLRNSIAHGSKKLGIDEKKYNELEKATLQIMEELLKLINDVIYEEKFYC